MTPQDTRWIRRHNHFTKALGQLDKFIQKGKLNELEEQGLIQAFEYTYELAWNTLKGYFQAQGETEIHDSRDAFRLAFQRGLIADGEMWMEMVRSRTLTTHTDNEEIAKQIASAIFQQYFPQFVKLHKKLELLRGDG